MALRLAGGLVLLLAALFFLLGAWISQDRDVYRESLEDSKVILADMKLLGEEANTFKEETGRFPKVAEIEARVDLAALERLGPKRRKMAPNDWRLGGTVSIASPGETCALGDESRLPESALRYDRLCYWRGEWFEEYVPETGEHSLPTSIEDYLASPWQTAAVGMFGLGLLACAYALVFPRRRRETVA